MKKIVSLEDRKQIFIIDAIRYLFVELNYDFGQLKQGLVRIEENLQRGVVLSETETLLTVTSGWRVIDTVFRIKGLLGQVKGLSQKTPELQIFQRSTATVENFRNFYQHLNSEISKVAEESGPILGYLSWRTSDPKLSVAVTIGTIPKDTQIHSLAYDRLENEIVDQILFVAGSIEIDLKALDSVCRKMRVFFDEWLESKGFLGEEQAHVGIFKMQIKL